VIKTVYADILFIVNFIINYLLLFITANVAILRISRARISAAAALGALYAVFSLFPSASLLISLPAKLLFGALMTLISFGKRFPIRTYLTFLALSAALAGVVFLISLLSPRTFALNHGFIYIDVSLPLLFSASTISYFILRIVFSRRGGGDKKTSRVIIKNGDKEVSLTALNDTGNSLRTPRRGELVVIVDYETIRDILPDCAKDTLDRRNGKNFPLALDSLKPSSRFSLIPYKTVGVSFSLLLAFSPDEVTVDGKPSKGAVCAISESDIADGVGYNALI